ncbi:hypothetical protein BSKO_00585 [Bryopsis sp. KO-2023]|nr:hypothetical protein BSKO_00585 [Bryopsis sp. KO-2023]
MESLLRCLALAGIIGFVVGATPPWTPCKVHGKTPLFTPTKVDLNPIGIKSGSDVVFTIDGVNTAHAVSAGIFDVRVSKKMTIKLPWGGVATKEIALYSESKSLCERADCPIPTGDVSFTYVKHIPGYTPPGDYSIKLVAKEEGTNEILMCLDVEISVSIFKANRKTMIAAS